MCNHLRHRISRGMACICFGALLGSSILAVTPAQAQPTAGDPCHVDSVLLAPQPNMETRLLEPVEYRFIETYDSNCQMNMKNILTPNLVCQPPKSDVTTLVTPDGKRRLQNSVTLSCRYKLAGYFFSSPLAIEFKQNQAVVQMHQLSVPPIHVTLLPKDAEKNAEFMALHAWHNRIPPILWGVLLILLGGIVLGIIQLRRRIKQRELENLPKPVEVVPPSPIDIFKDKVAILVNAQPKGEAQIKQYYDDVSEAVRKYLSSKLGLPVMESTTHQLVALLENHLSKTQIDEIVTILDECDLVKFSRVETNQPRQIMLLRDAKTIVTAIEEDLNSIITQANDGVDVQSTASRQAISPTNAATGEQILVGEARRKTSGVFTPQNIYVRSKNNLLALSNELKAAAEERHRPAFDDEERVSNHRLNIATRVPNRPAATLTLTQHSTAAAAYEQQPPRHDTFEENAPAEETRLARQATLPANGKFDSMSDTLETPPALV